MVAAAGVVRMTVSNHSAVDGAARIDVEAAGPAIEAVAIHREPGVEAVRMHTEEQTVYCLVESVN